MLFIGIEWLIVVCFISHWLIFESASMKSSKLSQHDFYNNVLIIEIGKLILYRARIIVFLLLLFCFILYVSLFSILFL